MTIDEWNTRPLGDFLELITYGFTNPMPTTATGPFMLTAKDIRHGQIDFEGARHTSPEAFSSSLTNKSRPRIGDVLLTKDGSIGRVAVCDRHDVCINQSVALLRPNAEILPVFLSYLLQAPVYQRRMESDSDGSTIKHIYITRVDKMPISVPGLRGQQAIVEVLRALDDKIAANTKLAATTDEFLSSTFNSLQTKGAEEVLLSVLGDVNVETVKPAVGGQLRYIDIASVGVGTYGFPNPIDWETAPSRARRRVRKGDTIWSTVRPNRRSHALNLSDDPLLVGSTGLAVLSPRTVGFAYLYEVTKRVEFTSYLETVAEGSAYPAVRADRFETALVPLLSEAERRSFEELAEPLRESLHSLAEENTALAATRDTLLPQLMSGKLRVKDAEALVAAAV